MSTDFIKADRDTPFLFPPSVQEWLPKDHLARFVVDMVGQLNVSSLRDVYIGKGSRPYDPALLLSLLFYGYSTGVFSSRKLEQATYDSVAFRFITGNQHPDHDTIAMFRKRFSAELKDLFKQILIIAHEMGILKLGTVSLDGTKVQANASKHQALSWQHACKIEQQLQKEVEQLWLLAGQADKGLIPDGMKIPEELERREKRLTTIAEAKKIIEARATERYEQEKQVYANKLMEREKKAKERGRKPGGKAPKPPEPGPKPHDQVNLTDEESRIMPTSGGGFMQAFNAPKIVFLDEPTGGVDPVTRRRFWDMIYKAAGRGLTIFVTTHYMDEAEYCDRLCIMVDGRAAALDQPEAMKQHYGAESMNEVFIQLARPGRTE